MSNQHQHLNAKLFVDEKGVLRRRFQPRELADTIASFFRRTKFNPDSGYLATPCLLWQGAKDRRGYGILSIDGERYLAHRVAFQLAFGEPTMPVTRHLCHNPGCVNPFHLAEGSPLDNHNDAKRAGRTPKGDRSGRRKHPEKFPVGEDCTESKLKVEDVMEIHRLYWTGKADSEDLAKIYKTSGTNIRAILFGKSWKREFGLAKTLYEMASRHRENLGKKRWSFDQAKAKEMIAKKDSGMSVEDIAKEYSLSTSSVYKAIRMYRPSN